MDFLGPNRFPKLSGNVVLLKPGFIEDTCGFISFLPNLSIALFDVIVFEVGINLGWRDALVGGGDVVDDVVAFEPSIERFCVNVIEPHYLEVKFVQMSFCRDIDRKIEEAVVRFGVDRTRFDHFPGSCFEAFEQGGVRIFWEVILTGFRGRAEPDGLEDTN